MVFNIVVELECLRYTFNLLNYDSEY